ncbi:MAG TPA: GFA family protein, partial [Terricaulis sp.]|nr:GFA family protein [Terricaulis sp.]
MSEVKAPVAEGGCQCGAVRYAFYAPLENAHACHCRMCQRAVGGAFALLAGGKKENFAWTKGEAAFYESSNVAKRAYCRDCGTPLTFAYDMPEARIYVTIGSLHSPEGAPLLKQYGVDSRLPW